MGTRTPNMSVYKPAPGEQVYDPAFSAGLDNVDSHDHSGAPNKGVQIGTSGIQDGAITPAKLSSEIISEATAQTTDATPVEIVAIAIAESQSITVSGRAIALLSTATEAAGGNFLGTFHRPTGGSVQIVGASVINWNDNSSGSPTITLIADVGSETISIRANGEAAKTINWHITYNSLNEPE